MESKPMTELPEDAPEAALGLDHDLKGMITALPIEELRAFLNALDHTPQLTGKGECFEVDDVIAEVDAELAARKTASGGHDGT